jgi:DNA invertase Pin-like site-specific DNA recombinase
VVRVVNDIRSILSEEVSGSKLVSGSKNIDETPADKLMQAMTATIAEFYSRQLGAETKQGRQRLAQAGGTPCRAPLGYLNVSKKRNGRVRGRVVVDPERGPIIKRAFERYARGKQSLQNVLREANEAGLSAQRRSRVGPSHFRQLLAHPYYKGLVRYSGREYAGQHEPLASEETWQRVQDRLDEEQAA